MNRDDFLSHALADFTENVLNKHGPTSPEVLEFLAWAESDEALFKLCHTAIELQQMAKVKAAKGGTRSGAPR